MDVIHVAEFVTLAENCDFQETADRLFISQSTLSRHIKLLETELGETLFTRSSRKVELNERGKMFLPYAKRIAFAYRDYMRTADQVARSVNGCITVGSVSILSHYNILDILSGYQKKYPGLKMDIIECNTNTLTEKVKSGQCDVAFILSEDHSEPQLPYVTYYTDTLIAALPKDHPLACYETVQMEQLRDESFILQRDRVIHDLTLRVCRQSGFEPKAEDIKMHTRYIFDLIQRGQGCTLALKRHAEKLGGGKVTILDIVPPVKVRIDVIYHDEGTNKLPIRELVEYIQQYREN